jgi:TolB-like protein
MSFFEELKRRNVVRVGIAYLLIAWVLLQGLDFGLDLIDAPNWVIQALFMLAAIGLPAVLVFSWVYEMTPQGLKRDHEVDPEQSITPETGRKLNRVITVFLVLVVAWFAFDEFYLERNTEELASSRTDEQSESDPGPIMERPAEPTPAISSSSIAVLPFADMSPEGDQEFFSDGISEELINVLVKVSALEVSSRTSSFAYKGKDTPISQIARELEVANVLEGSVRKAGNKVRITAQLIDAKTDKHLWSETYDRELDDIFAIQTEISNHIVEALKVALAVEEVAAMAHEQRPTENVEAYEQYLLGRHFWRLRHEENLALSRVHFQNAIDLDPEFAKAYEGLASAWAVMPAWSDTSNEEALGNAEPYALKALELDSGLPLARGILGEIEAFHHNWSESLRQYAINLQENPRNSTVHQWNAEMVNRFGYGEEALQLILRAYELDPASPVINQSAVWVAAMRTEDDLARKHAEIARGLGMADRVDRGLFSVRVRGGEWDTLKAWAAAHNAHPLVTACIDAYQTPDAKPDLAVELVALMEGGEYDGANGVLLVDCLAYNGRPDIAVQRIGMAVENFGWEALWPVWAVRPGAQAMRDTEEFKNLIRNLDLDSLYRERGWPDLCRPLGEDDFECD